MTSPGDFIPASAAASPTAGPPQFTDGTYDLYGLGDMWNQSVLTGTSRTNEEHGAHGRETTIMTPQTATAESILKGYASLSATNPNAFAAFQSELYNSGHYSGKPTFGVWTAKDGDALSEALRGFLGISQTGAPITFAEWLSQSANIGAADNIANGSGGGSTRAPLQVTSASTLDAFANNAAQSDLGRNASAGEQSKFVNTYHGEEQAAYNGGGTAASDPSAEATTTFQTGGNNAEYQTHLQAGYADRMLSMLGVTQ